MPAPTGEMPAPSSTGTFETHDGLQLFTQSWKPDEPAATVVLVHGYGEHSGRYAHLARRLNERRIAVYAYDLRGHGRSSGPRAYVETFDEHVDDLQRFVRLVRQEAPARPFFLMGHSMGGTTVLLGVLERGMEAAGLVLSSPAIRLQQQAPLLQQMAPLVGRLFPRLPTIHIDEEDLSHDPDVVRAVENDPLHYRGRLKARMGSELMRAGHRVERQAHTLTLPFYLFQGSADPIADPEGARHLHARAAAEDKTLRLYDGLYHEPLNERLPDRELVLDEMTAWLVERRGT